MKKLLSIIAALALCGSLASCGEDDNTATDTTAETTTAASTTVVSEVLEEPPQKQTQSETESVTEETAAETVAETAVIEETTVTEETTEVTADETTTAETENVIETEAEKSAEEEILADDDGEDFVVNNKFADMDEFLTADIFMLDGKTVTADKALSSDIFDSLKGNFYLETASFEGEAPFKFAVKGDMIMTETEVDGKANKMIIRDSKAYTFDHENKVALYLPAEKELVSQYKPEKMGIIPENISTESFVIADVTIGGKAYKFEYGISSDWAMLYDADGKLYASIKSGDSLDMTLCKFSVTSKIPSGTFDIPNDYFQLDLEEMMKNAPPPEEME